MARRARKHVRHVRYADTQARRARRARKERDLANSIFLGNSEADQSDTLLGAVEFAVVQKVAQKETKPKTYTRWTDKDRYLIEKYSSANSNAAAMRKFRTIPKYHGKHGSRIQKAM